MINKVNAKKEDIDTEQIDGYPIVRKYKYLGVMFDEALKFDEHLTMILTKIQKGIKIIKLMLWKGLSIW